MEKKRLTEEEIKDIKNLIYTLERDITIFERIDEKICEIYTLFNTETYLSPFELKLKEDPKNLTVLHSLEEKCRKETKKSCSAIYRIYQVYEETKEMERIAEAYTELAIMLKEYLKSNKI